VQCYGFSNLGIIYLPDDWGQGGEKSRTGGEPLNPSLFVPCNVQNEEHRFSLPSQLSDKWGVRYPDPLPVLLIKRIWTETLVIPLAQAFNQALEITTDSAKGLLNP